MLDSRVLDRAVALAHEYLGGIEDEHVGPRASPAELRAALDLPLADAGIDPGLVIEDLARAVAPGLVASAGPRYFGFVIGGSVPAALAADWLTSVWDQNAAIYAAAPAACAAEAVCARWIVELFGLPPGSTVGFVTGGQMGNFTGLAAARHAVLKRAGWDVERRGLAGAPPVRIILGEEAHVTVLSAVRMLGLGTDSVDRIAADGQGRMRPDALEEQLSSGSGPAIICAQAGNIDTGTVDPLAEITEIARRHDAWCHVDGAFGLWAAASPAQRGLVAGVENADSWVADAHKWLNVPYDSSFAIVRDPNAHRGAMGLSAAYLTPPGGEERWPAEWAPELSRRARAFPVYAALRSLGREGVAGIVESCCARAAQFAELLEQLPQAEILNEVTLNQVLVRFDDDATTDAVIRAVQDDGVCWLAGTTWRGRRAMRISICNWGTSPDDVERSVQSIAAAAQQHGG